MSMTTRAPGRSNKIAETTATPYISIADAAMYLGVTERTVRVMIADGRLTGYRLGGRVIRLRLSEIDAAMQPFGG
jgi:excisionase family DNA binding protein